MQKKIIIGVIIIVVLGVLGGGYSYYSGVQEQQKIVDEKAKETQLAQQAQEQALAEEASRTKCVEGDNFSIVTRDRKDSGVGQDIIVKTKTTDAGHCTYSVVDGDFELTNTDPQYYKAQVSKSLVTDIGTGPSGRKFRLYDLTDKSLVTEKDYFGDLNVASGTLTYFGVPKAKVTMKNCKDGTVTVKKIIDLSSFSAKETKETNCAATQ